tara:strand:+ start:512 stop:790 length:279 start_codon:yes stop_codon:yes gene_type:complete
MTDIYLSELGNKLKEKIEEKKKKDLNWIEEKIKNSLPKEEDLKDISKQMLAHNIGILEEKLKTITKERDDISDENKRLTEENSNLETLLKQK